MNSINESDPEFESIYTLFEGDEEAVKQVFATFLDDLPNTVSGLKEDIEKKDWASARKKAHRIKPFYGYSGDKEMINLIDTWQLDKPAGMQRLEDRTKFLIDRISIKFNL